MTEVFEKWGFGMAPPKPPTQRDRARAVTEVVELLGRTQLPAQLEGHLDHLSTVKGLFNRVAREDQWDWFTVMGQLGYPSRRLAKAVGDGLSSMRTSIKSADEAGFLSAKELLLRLGVGLSLQLFLGQRELIRPADAGWIYVLSSRELPDLLKVGMTTRSVEERVREINSATGVAIPFGVRRCWCVRDPAAAEKIAHERLSPWRLRGDREFFRADFPTAASQLSAALVEAGLEIPTFAIAMDSGRNVSVAEF